jgi:hypothetical protein
MRGALLLAVACLASVCLAQDALFHESVGLHCSKSSDCGYVPALACISKCVMQL